MDSTWCPYLLHHGCWVTHGWLVFWRHSFLYSTSMVQASYKYNFHKLTVACILPFTGLITDQTNRPLPKCVRLVVYFSIKVWLQAKFTTLFKNQNSISLDFEWWNGNSSWETLGIWPFESLTENNWIFGLIFGVKIATFFTGIVENQEANMQTMVITGSFILIVLEKKVIVLMAKKILKNLATPCQTWKGKLLKILLIVIPILEFKTEQFVIFIFWMIWFWLILCLWRIKLSIFHWASLSYQSHLVLLSFLPIKDHQL